MEEVYGSKGNLKNESIRFVYSKTILRLLVLCILFLVSISTFLSYLKFRVLNEYINLVNIGLTFFSLDREKNIPTYFSTLILLCCSVLLFIIFLFRRKQRDKEYGYWGGLAIIFLILSLDEFVGFHELTVDPVKEALNLSGFLSFGWVVPAFFVLIIFGVAFFKFVISLDTRIRYWFIISGALYLSGALGMELIGGYLMETSGSGTFIYALCTNIEETLEMLGISFFIYTLLKYIQIIKPNGIHFWVKGKKI